MPGGWFFECGCTNGAIKLALAGTQYWWRRFLGGQYMGVFVVGISIINCAAAGDTCCAWGCMRVCGQIGLES